MKRIAALLGLILWGCADTNRCVYGPKNDKDTYRSSAEISERNHKLIFDAGLSSSDVNALNKLADEFVATSVGKITIIPISRSSQEAKKLENAANLVREIFEKRRIKKHVIDLQPCIVDKEAARNVVQIKSYKYDLKLPTASKWKYDVGDIDVEKKMPNLGVATSYNLGLMIANPRDLVDPAGMGMMDGKSAVAAVRQVIHATNRVGGSMGSSTSSMTSSSSSSFGNSSSSSTSSSFK